ncbi:hypothetical protein [uncultured Alistipes sp.]|mgnify:FL=1|uniref:hypothetical protein n=1 Tax=uncultured Alistipes sp. TaxID=538949 RepID=UPI00258F2A2E|nr:hypothetical protein [uncultured Alistipes sp.]
MYVYVILLALAVTLLSLTAAFAVCICCRRMEREKNRSIILRIREQDRTAKELEHTRIEKQTLEKVVETALSQAPGTARNAGPCTPDTVRTNDETQK